MAELSEASEPWNFCTTDAHGHFYLNDLDRALGVVVVSESGFGWSATNEFSANMAVKLEPWGRIEGTFWHYNEVVTNEPVRVFFALQDGLPIWDPDSGFNTKTDDRGHFSFDFVPPGHFGIESAGLGERITVKSGQTAVVTLGGRGRRVVGRFKIRNPDGKVEPADEFRYAFFTSTDIGAKTKEEWEVLRKQPIWEKAFTNFHARPVQCAKDGSFHIDQVEPGKYELFVETSSVANSNRLWLFGRRAVEITATDPKIPEPLDVGLIELSLNSRSGANK